MDHEKIVKELIRDEGLRLKPYRDTEGKLTIGVGRNLDDNGISTEEAIHMLNNDIRGAVRDAHLFSWYEGLSDARQRVIVNMLFNLGLTKFRGFRRMIAALEAGDYEEAARQMEDSRWCRQVGPRCRRLMEMMRRG